MALSASNTSTPITSSAAAEENGSNLGLVVRASCQKKEKKKKKALGVQETTNKLWGPAVFFIPTQRPPVAPRRG